MNLGDQENKVRRDFDKLSQLNQKKVLILISNNQIGGITSSTHALSQSLQTDCDVKVGYFGPNWQQGRNLENFINFRVSWISKKSKVLKAVFRLKSLMVYLARNQCHIVICQDPSSSLIAFLARTMFPKLRIIGMCHVSRDLLTRIDVSILKFIYPKLNKVVVPSIYISEELDRICNHLDLRVIPNSLSDEIARCSWPRNTDVKKGSYIFLGRLEKEKNPEMILSMALVDPENEYVICGDGSQLENLKNITIDQSIDNVTFLGFRDAFQVLNQGSVVVIPSLTESFGLVAIESWLHGVPTLVSSNSRGIVEMLTIDDLGLALDLDKNPIEWKNTAKKLSNNGISNRTITKILERYHSSSQLKDWLILINQGK